MALKKTDYSSKLRKESEKVTRREGKKEVDLDLVEFIIAKANTIKELKRHLEAVLSMRELLVLRDDIAVGRVLYVDATYRDAQRVLDKEEG